MKLRLRTYLTLAFTSLIRSRNTVIAGIISFSIFLTGCSGGNDSSDISDPLIVTESEDLQIIIEHEPAILTVENVCDATVPVGLNTDMQSAISLAESRYLDLLEQTTASSRKYIDYTSASGDWELQSASRWTSGFLPGILWYLYGLTKTETWKTEAEISTAGLQIVSTATDNDTGFQIYGSYGIGREILNIDWAEADIAINDAANTLFAQRYNPDIGAFRAWPQNESDPYQVNESDPFEVNVDMIMNMQAVFSAVEKSGDSAQFNAAISHADVTWEHLIRADFSSYHVAGFNADGNVEYTRTHQGWLEESTWSRGQSWAVYGYAMVYSYTQLPRMLERAEKAYQYFKQATQTQSMSWIPYADFNAPIDIRNPLDTSAAAIVASSALQLYEITGNTLYLSDANDILNELTQNYKTEGTEFQSLLLSASEQYVREDDDQTPNTAGYEVGASFGDFYFLEALYRLSHSSVPTCN